MKLVIASDIHGAASWCRKLMQAIEQQQPDKVLLLGDLLYNGPRNPVPQDYAPKEVLAMLNSIAPNVIAVRGNCEAEVDQMVLDFPCLGVYNVLYDPDVSTPDGKGLELFCTHGHVYGEDNPPNVPAGTVLVFGHTHVKVNGPSQQFPSLRLFNPGSVGLPKDGTHSYGVYQDGEFAHMILE